ncbi:MAG: histidinol-phosphatase HisJ family protein [bacterium]|nr:histidinol-phosphatase HisJ family protein [bacterium]
MIDYHIHTELCGHASGHVEDYIEKALAIGLTEIGFADHFPVLYQPKFSLPIRSITMSEDKIPAYLRLIETAKSKSKNLSVRTGFEVDYYIHDNLFFNKYLNLLSHLDYIIGSVHFLDEWGFDQPEFKDRINGKSVTGLWRDYLLQIRNMVNEHGNDIDIIGHLDLPKKLDWPVPDEFQEEFRSLIRLIRGKELVVEINTSGYDKPVKEFYPSPAVLTLLKDEKVEITLGSDSHKPDEVGRYFRPARDLLKKTGFNKVIKFDQHKKDFIYL